MVSLKLDKSYCKTQLIVLFININENLNSSIPKLVVRFCIWSDMPVFVDATTAIDSCNCSGSHSLWSEVRRLWFWWNMEPVTSSLSWRLPKSPWKALVTVRMFSAWTLNFSSVDWYCPRKNSSSANRRSVLASWHWVASCQYIVCKCRIGARKPQLIQLKKNFFDC